MDVVELGAYKKWKADVPFEIRSLVEGKLMEKKVRLGREELPSVAEFYEGMKTLLVNPQADVTTLEIAPVIQKQLAALQRIKIGEGVVNVFAALADEKIGFEVKANYVATKLEPRLHFLRDRDRRLVEQAREQDKGIEVTGEEEEEEYSPHRAPSQESEGLPSEAIATIAPFFGGYVTDTAFDLYDPVTITWKKSPRRHQEFPEQELDTARGRIYRSSVKNSQGIVKLPRHWGVDRASVKWVGAVPEAWSLIHDQDGMVRLRTSGSESGVYSIDIAPSSDAIDLAPPEGDVPAVNESFSQEIEAFAQELFVSRISFGAKVRRLASKIYGHLEYDMDPQWDAVYKADTSRYFESIWEHKKAKCDEANTMLTRLLMKQGVHARFMGGHSVRAKSPAGEAMLMESNRHAWSMAWDDGTKEWIRLDATPAGDPNVDQEEQKQDLGEGDYGEQEAEIMSEEELEKRLAKMEKEESAREVEQNPELGFAKEAGCTPEVARDVLQKIAELRRKYSQVLQDADRQWQKLVRENTKERIVDRGPVAMSQMDEIDPDELVSGYVEVLAGEKDPLLGEREEIEKKKEKWFGGYEVYIAADMSGSMDETLNGVKKVDAQRDMVFLLVDSVMTAAVLARQKDRSVKAPMPVRVSVAVFGQATEVVLPLTGEWTPKEQVKLYRALDKGAGGGTPDHVSLAQLRQAIVESTKTEEEVRAKKPVLKKHGWKMRRFVIATADGGSDDASAVKRANEALKAEGIPVDLFLLSPEGDENLKQAAERAYQSVTPVSDVGDLASKGLTRLTRRIAEAYKQTV